MIVERLTPMMKQYHEIKLRHPGILLFFRLGDFYEMFYEDAVVASRDLEITLTSRNSNAKGQPIPMCGVPHHAIDNYLGRLIRKGHKVALCEQVENPRQVKGLVRREVVRIVTPGTVIEEGVLDSKENNYLGSLLQRNDRVGLSFLDLSTGEFWITEFSGRESWQRAREELALFGPGNWCWPRRTARGSAKNCRLPITGRSPAPFRKTGLSIPTTPVACSWNIFRCPPWRASASMDRARPFRPVVPCSTTSARPRRLPWTTSPRCASWRRETTSRSTRPASETWSWSAS